MRRVGYLGLGSNKGQRRQYLTQALQALDRLGQLQIMTVSPVYETEPLHIKEQGNFYNMAVKILTEYSAEKLLQHCKGIEGQLGRDFQQERYGPRVIDIDILYLDRLVIVKEELQVPHPQIRKRRFVLVPLAQIAPEFKDPQTEQTIAGMLARCEDTADVQYLGKLDWRSSNEKSSKVILSEHE